MFRLSTTITSKLHWRPQTSKQPLFEWSRNLTMIRPLGWKIQLYLSTQQKKAACLSSSTKGSYLYCQLTLTGSLHPCQLTFSCGLPCRVERFQSFKPTGLYIAAFIASCWLVFIVFTVSQASEMLLNMEMGYSKSTIPQNTTTTITTHRCCY
jgi:hypothetical protein